MSEKNGSTKLQGLYKIFPSTNGGESGKMARGATINHKACTRWFPSTNGNMGSKQYGVDHLNMEINKFTVERKVYHRLNQSQFRISILVFFRVNFTGY